MRTQYLLLLTWCIGYANANAQTIRIPADYPTIQAGIDHAAAGDTVLVSPGIYSENLNFNGLDIVLASFYLTSGSTDFIAQTIIDGGNHTAVITLDQGESSYAEITGFTLVNGTHDESIQWPEFGGGIVCLGASPFIHHNRILNCRGRALNYSDFGGIYCRDSGARIFENEIDSIECFFVKKLGGIVSHRSALIIHKNAIRNISGGYVFQGGGVSADSSELDLFRNVIAEGHFDLAPYTASVRLGDSIRLHATVNQTGVIFQWTPDIYLNDAAIADPVSTPFKSVLYALSATDDRGCQKTDTVRITVRIDRDSGLYIPDAFTPNNDNVNDIFYVRNSNPAVIRYESFQVFDKYDEKVFDAAERTLDMRRVQYMAFLQVIEVDTGLVKWQAETDVTKAYVADIASW